MSTTKKGFLSTWIVVDPDGKPKSMTLVQAFDAISITAQSVHWNARYRASMTYGIESLTPDLEETRRLIEKMRNTLEAWTSLLSTIPEGEEAIHTEEKINIATAVLNFLEGFEPSLNTELQFKRFRRRMSRWSGWGLAGSLIIAFTNLLILPLLDRFIPEGLLYGLVGVLVTSIVFSILAEREH